MAKSEPVTHTKRIIYRSQKSTYNLSESTINAMKWVARCIISLNFTAAFDMIVDRGKRKVYLFN